MQLLLAVSVVLAAAVFSNVECDSRLYTHEPRLFSGGWGWGKKPIITVSKGWGWKKPVIKGIGLYGGIALHHGSSQGWGGWGGKVQHGWGGGGGGGGGGHGGWGGWGPQIHHQSGWGGWGQGGGGGGGQGWGGWGGDDDDDGGWGWERALPLERSDLFAEEDSSAESGEVQPFAPISEFNDLPYYEPVFV